ncbi:MAG TPA: hypothetical protein HPP97_05030 [Desulfuromonadales bacterium]|nr:hypothetical protein [Desulfuromonadales bacterium]
MKKLCVFSAVLYTLTVGLAASAEAAGTLAGTAISNQAYADYKDANGNAMTRVFSNTVTVSVSQVAGINVDPASISSTAKNGDVIYFHVQSFNTGNANDSQTYTYATSGAWTPTSVRMFHDANNNHVYDSGDGPSLLQVGSLLLMSC